ncbi:MAG: DedA family protein [Sulfolobaceae archaeon]|nr:DedA family protein [Sulfolobaceae archaeon]
MVLEALGLPIPSEVVMPLVGYYAARGQINPFFGLLIGTMGSLVGSLISYELALYLGRFLLIKYGRYIGLTSRRLNSLELWFSKHGSLAVLLFRYVPGLRALISYPAGLARMRIMAFIALTFIGHITWDSIFLAIGIVFSNQINSIIVEAEKFGNIFAIIAIILIVVYLIYKIFIER